MAAANGNTNAKGNKGGGRRPTFKPEYVELAYKMCLLGLIDAQLAGVFDVTEMTINAWKKKYPEFKDALMRGKVIADAEVANSLYRKAIGYVITEEHILQHEGAVTQRVNLNKQIPPDTASMIFWLKNRSGWRDKQEVQHSGAMVIFNGEDELED